MSYGETAKFLFNSGFNCAQSVLGSLAEELGLEQETALAIAGGLGGGCACGELCGALSGGILAIGAQTGFSDGQNLTAKENAHAKTAAFTVAFREKFGAVRCFDLLGHDLTSDEGRAIHQNTSEREDKCTKYVMWAAEHCLGDKID
ncbi:MAG: C-GCAxxG-C-C family protein [Oscillospiraceae bacterium]|nr:C-GCAxxG-C-C family protein [Oscillospiraceae bacterium]